jgi:RsiW-degrading membrane proteinase PrsW (M82 family)
VSGFESSTIRRIFSLIALLVLMLTSVGCRFEVAGISDLDLAYEVVDPSSAHATSLVERIRGRLGAAQITADVTMNSDREAHVVFDAEQRKTVEAMLRWEGGVSFFRPSDVHANAVDSRAVPAFSITDIANVETTQRGRSIRITFKPSAAIPAGAASGPYVVACDRALLGTVTQVELTKPLEFSLGNDLESYAEAAFLTHLLETPTLPTLKETAATPLPASWFEASLGLLLPLCISLSWLVFVRRFDRAHPEPSWLVLGTFALGGLGVVAAAFIEGGLASASRYLNPGLMSFGGQTWALPIAIVIFAITVGAVEEGVKLAAVFFFARRRSEFDEPVDGIVYGTAAALGFAAIENMKYFALGRLSPSVIVMRTLTSAPAHLFFGAIWGYALGMRLVSRRRRLPLFFAIAALLHGSFDALLSSLHGAILILPLQLGLATTFIVLLRRSLRHGAVREDTIPASALERLRLPLGSNARFFGSAAAMHIAAVAVGFVGLYFEASHRRVDLFFFACAVGALTLFGLSAAGVTANLPLDLVVDDQGVTFGGSARRWNEISRVERLGGELTIHCKNADNMHLGPANPHALDLAEAAIVERFAARG